MFTVSESEAAAIRAAFEQQGELSAAIELRRLFSRGDGQRAGAGVRSRHIRLDAVAVSAQAASGQGALNKRSGPPRCHPEGPDHDRRGFD
jgi:hypothetical protein